MDNLAGRLLHHLQRRPIVCSVEILPQPEGRTRIKTLLRRLKNIL